MLRTWLLSCVELSCALLVGTLRDIPAATCPAYVTQSSPGEQPDAVVFITGNST